MRIRKRITEKNAKLNCNGNEKLKKQVQSSKKKGR